MVGEGGCSSFSGNTKLQIRKILVVNKTKTQLYGKKRRLIFDPEQLCLIQSKVVRTFGQTINS